MAECFGVFFLRVSLMIYHFYHLRPVVISKKNVFQTIVLFFGTDLQNSINNIRSSIAAQIFEFYAAKEAKVVELFVETCEQHIV